MMSKWPLTAAAIDVHKRLLLRHMSASLLLLRMSKGSVNQICIMERRASDSTRRRRRRHRRIAIVILNI